MDEYNNFLIEHVIIDELDFIFRFQKVYVQLKKDFPDYKFNSATLIKKNGADILQVTITYWMVDAGIDRVLTFIKRKYEKEFDYDKS